MGGAIDRMSLPACRKVLICKKLSFLHFADTQRSVYSTFLCCKQTFGTECCTRITRRLRLAFGEF